MLLVLAFVVGAAPQAVAPAPAASSADQNCIVSGKVSNSLTGEPLKKATVQLMPHGVPFVFGSSGARVMDASGGTQGYSTTSQADGSFAFENVRPGDYLLLGQRTGYLNTQYGAKRPLGSGTALSLKPGQQKTDVNLALIPQAVITGKVVDEDGDPLSGVMVQVIRQRWMQGKMSDMPQGSTQTNDLGEFRLSGMRPGKCYLVARKMNFDPHDPLQVVESGKPQLRPVRTFYPEALSRDAATPLELQAGQDLSGIDIRMHSMLTYHVRGKVAGISEGEGERVMVSVRSPGEQFGFPASQTMLGKAYTFDIAGVSPGTYELVVQSMGGGKNALTAHQQIEVGAGDLNDVILNVQAPASLKGRAQVEGNPSGQSGAVNLSSIQIALRPADPTITRFGPAPTGTPGADGTFTLENVSAGKYTLSANPPNGTYLQSVKLGAQEVRGKYLEVGSGGAGELDIVFRYGAAQVNGTVQAEQHANSSDSASGSQPAASANVLLVPEELNEDGSGLNFNSTDGSGAFSFRPLRPGRYKAYALEDATFADVQNPEVIKELESRGTEVEVKENDSKQIQLPVISASDFQQVLTKLGLSSSQ